MDFFQFHSPAVPQSEKGALPVAAGVGDGEKPIVEGKICCPGECVRWQFEGMRVGCLSRIVGRIRDQAGLSI